MNDTQHPTVTPTSRLKRPIVAGIISTVIYCCLTLTIGPWLRLLLPYASPEAGTIYWIRDWIFWLLIMLSVPGFAFGMQAGYIISPDSGIDTGMYLTIVVNLLLWFSLGAISSLIFRRNKLAVIMWGALACIIEISGWIIASIIFRGLQL